MKRNYKVLSGCVLLVALVLTSCTKYFNTINTDPNSVLSVTPEQMFARATINAHNGDFEWFYDYYEDMMPWMQMLVPSTGNAAGFLVNAGITNNRYGYFYGGVGNYLTEAQHIIDNMPANQKAAYVYEKAIAQVLKVYYSFYVSDINGDIPYTQAFQARYGGTKDPKYDHQDSLFGIWDQQLKSVVTTLKSSQPVTQASFGNYDLYYQGNVSAWIKCAASLRLMIAMRLMQREPSVLQSIANEVISSGDLMSSNSDSWIFVGGQGFTAGGNWNPAQFVGNKGCKPMVDFMWNTQDPRIGIFFRKNDYDSATYALAQQQGVLDANTAWNPRQYVGMVVSPDEVNTPYGKSLIAHTAITNAKGKKQTLDTASFVQYRLFQAERADANGTPGTGYTSFPILTYASVCFMRAELGARGITSDDPATWYNNGITASIQQYYQFAKIAAVENYQQMQPTAAQIQAYLSNPTVQYNSSKGLEQIICQAFINYFKQANEAWALYKRTGMPNATTDLPHVPFVSSGVTGDIPRRAAISTPAPGQANYQNIQAAIQHMESDPGFGDSPSDIFGRVWWDSK